MKPTRVNLFPGRTDLSAMLMHKISEQHGTAISNSERDPNDQTLDKNIKTEPNKQDENKKTLTDASPAIKQKRQSFALLSPTSSNMHDEILCLKTNLSNIVGEIIEFKETYQKNYETTKEYTHQLRLKSRIQASRTIFTEVHKEQTFSIDTDVKFVFITALAGGGAGGVGFVANNVAYGGGGGGAGACFITKPIKVSKGTLIKFNIGAGGQTTSNDTQIDFFDILPEPSKEAVTDDNAIAHVTSQPKETVVDDDITIPTPPPETKVNPAQLNALFNSIVQNAKNATNNVVDNPVSNSIDNTTSNISADGGNTTIDICYPSGKIISFILQGGKAGNPLLSHVKNIKNEEHKFDSLVAIGGLGGHHRHEFLSGMNGEDGEGDAPGNGGASIFDDGGSGGNENCPSGKNGKYGSGGGGSVPREIDNMRDTDKLSGAGGNGVVIIEW